MTPKNKLERRTAFDMAKQIMRLEYMSRANTAAALEQLCRLSPPLVLDYWERLRRQALPDVDRIVFKRAYREVLRVYDDYKRLSMAIDHR